MYIKKKLPLFIALLVSIPLIVLTATIYYYSSEQLIQINKTKINEVVTVEAENISVILSMFSNEIEDIAQNKKVKDFIINRDEKSKNQAYEYIKNKSEIESMSYLSEFRNFILKPKLKYRSVILGSRGEILLDTDDKQYIPEGLNYEIMKNVNINRVYMKPIYTDKYDSKLLVAVPVVSDNNIIGVYCAYFDIDEIGFKFFNYEIGKNRYTYISDLNGTILYHPDIDRIGTKVENDLLNNIINRINNGEKIEEYSGIYEYRGTKKYMALKYMKSTGWIIVVAQDLSEILSVSRNITFLSLILLITFIFISLRFGIRFSDTITTPLTNLMNAMKATEEGELEQQFIYNREDEFGSLSRTYNSMINRLKNNYTELEALYEELAATEEELRVQYENLMNSEEQLRISEERYRIALEAGKYGIFEWSTKDDILYLSEQFKILIGYDFEDIKVRDLINEIVLQEDRKILYSAYREHIEGRRTCIECEIRVNTGYGVTRWMYIKGRVIKEKEGEKIISGAMMDITERKEYEEDIKYLAFYDTLTDLPNRRYFIEELEKEIKDKDKNKKFAVLLLDLDNFKKVNDTLGHDKGDALLRKVASILKKYANDNVFVARFGGDEFLILLRQFSNLNEIKALAKNIIHDLKEGIDVIGKNIYTTTSIGIAIVPDDGDNVNDIIKNADTAMYKAKSEGKNRYIFFSAEMIEELEKRIETEKILLDCLKNKDFKLVYQPQVSSKTGEVHAFEALIRLKNYNISPAEFIPVAEETGLIVEIGYFVIEEAVRQIKEWIDKGIEVKPIGVNLSAVQLRDESFVSNLKEIIKKYSIKPSLLKIEITESALMEDKERNIKIIEQLKEVGIQIAIDDFGTGYSSLNYLTFIPADYIKLDKSFIDKMFAKEGKKEVLDGITFLAHQLNLKVVVEGIEDREQFNYLKSKGCDYMQGYLFSRPVDKEEAEKLFAKRFEV
ncbi:EAL domain-containing protein [Caloramator proteoclasticus]|uniref:PAS domain S-box-containing protein/diguanylate cyclase (GGDEF) domain-containing protein n=1 Tax=Caloramator proteoclasticus DSM 10124 TaxID=1121262 RepID=A0A1M4VHT2_9CLOT|nr:EAL domain-containing protein [Caloramator proteoclasticus]SHE68508.1 PAS domain S-box-containing protein/diguanylate cyclase (GGDEF) domain-containing protein [Caloramator proteoclasticus DSM 10124]